MKQNEIQAELRLNTTPETIFAVYRSKENCIVLNARKLSEYIAEKSSAAREVGVDFGDLENVWIAKFASVISHEIIHKVLTELEGDEISKRFDRLYFAEFMEKIPPNSIDMSLWSDAFETCPIGDTWFG